jgi:hypothetical protein
VNKIFDGRQQRKVAKLPRKQSTMSLSPNCKHIPRFSWVWQLGLLKINKGWKGINYHNPEENHGRRKGSQAETN